MNNYKQNFIETNRLKTAYYRAGEGNREKLIVLHGNISSSVFFLPLLPYLEDRYDIIVPDLRCFGHSQALPIDATRGYRDWSDDIYEFCKALKIRKFTLLGWSLGGDIAMQFACDHPKMVKKLVLVCPGSPYGFGGTMDEKGTPHMPLGLGSGGGTTNPMLVFAGKLGNSSMIRQIARDYLFGESFQMTEEWEDIFLEESSLAAIGPDYYPGDSMMTWKWPYVVAGDRGVLNTMSPKHGNLRHFLDIDPKPPVLWIRGDIDQIVSDESMMELGNLGRLHLLPGWPGMRAYPPQPMIKQTRHFFEQYKERGGKYIELEISGGHMCILESPVHFIKALDTFIAQK